MKAELATLALLSLAAALAGGACSSAPKLPPGLPPPEYEHPAVTPWPAADAGTVPNAEGDHTLVEAKPGELADLVDAQLSRAGAPGE